MMTQISRIVPRSNDGIYNGAIEVCDDIDQDCDGDLVETFTDGPPNVEIFLKELLIPAKLIWGPTMLAAR